MNITLTGAVLLHDGYFYFLYFKYILTAEYLYIVVLLFTTCFFHILDFLCKIQTLLHLFLNKWLMYQEIWLTAAYYINQ